MNKIIIIIAIATLNLPNAFAGGKEDFVTGGGLGLVNQSHVQVQDYVQNQAQGHVQNQAQDKANDEPSNPW